MGDEEQKATSIWEMREHGKSYQDMCGLTKRMRTNTAFYEGEQWMKPTKENIGMPRPIIDITSFTVNNKLSKVSGIPVDLVFASNSTEDNAEGINRYWSYWKRKSKFDKHFRKAIKKAAVHCGALMFLTYYGGKLHIEVINARDVFVADSRCNDSIQKQDWVIIQQRVTLNKVKKLADKGIDLSLIKPDRVYDDTADIIEQDGTDMCTLLHRFFRINGEVYYERALRDIVISEAKPLAPDVEAIKKTELYKRIAEEIDNIYGVGNLGKKQEDSDDKKKAEKNKPTAALYPFTYFTWYETEDSFYGKSEVDTLISDQRAINVSIGIMLLGAQSEATGKTVVKKNALGNQKITNDPTQVLIDHSPGGNGFYKLTPTQMNMASITLLETLIKYIRMTKGVSEVSTGEAYGANASGAAIAQLQSQANGSSEMIRDHIWESLGEFGEVLLQMWKLYFSGETKVNYKFSETSPDTDKPEVQDATFDGNIYPDISDVEVTVKAVKGTNSSLAGDIQMLEAALAAGQIDFEDLIKAYPDDAISDKRRYLQLIQQRQEKDSVKLAEQITQLMQAVEQIQKQSEEKDKYIERLVDVVKSTNELRNNAAQIVKRDEDLKNQIVMEGAKRVSTEYSLEMESQQNAQLKGALYSASSDVATLQNERELSQALLQAQGGAKVETRSHEDVTNTQE